MRKWRLPYIFCIFILINENNNIFIGRPKIFFLIALRSKKRGSPGEVKKERLNRFLILSVDISFKTQNKHLVYDEPFKAVLRDKYLRTKMRIIEKMIISIVFIVLLF